MSAHTVSRSREADYDTWRADGGGAAWSALLREEELSLQQVVLGSLLTSFTLHDEKIC